MICLCQQRKPEYCLSADCLWLLLSRFLALQERTETAEEGWMVALLSLRHTCHPCSSRLNMWPLQKIRTIIRCSPLMSNNTMWMIWFCWFLVLLLSHYLNEKRYYWNRQAVGAIWNHRGSKQIYFARDLALLHVKVLDWIFSSLELTLRVLMTLLHI